MVRAAGTGFDLALIPAQLPGIDGLETISLFSDEVVGRLAQLALESLQRRREPLDLARIKARHERVLARYRSLPREP